MAVFLRGVSGTPSNWEVRVQPGTWAVALEDPPRLVPVADDAPGARLEIGARSIRVVPGGDAVRINADTLTAPAHLRPGDQLALGPVVLCLEVRAAGAAPVAAPTPLPAASRPVPARPAAVPAAAAAPTPAAPPQPTTGMALPPPDPPKWRFLFPLAAVVVIVVIAIAAWKKLPERQSGPEVQLSPEVRRKVQAATVWIKNDERGAQGSGYVAAKGCALTNAHVVEGARRVKVTFGAGSQAAVTVPADVVKTGTPGTERDIAVLHLETGAVQPLKLADLGALSPGSPVVAFGYPLGSDLQLNQWGPEISVRGGKVTALRREGSGIAWVESDAPIEPGNSGGPMVTAGGDVVGLATLLIGLNLRTAWAVSAATLLEFAPQVAH